MRNKSKTKLKPRNVDELKARISAYFFDCLQGSCLANLNTLTSAIGCSSTDEFWEWRQGKDYTEEWRTCCDNAFTMLHRVRWFLRQKDSYADSLAEIWEYAKERKAETAEELESQLNEYLENYKEYALVPYLEIMELVAGAHEEGEFLRWCDGVGCSIEWRDVCRAAYRKMRKILLSRRVLAVKHAQETFQRVKESLDRSWLHEQKEKSATAV